MRLSKGGHAGARNTSMPKHTQPMREVMMPEDNNNNQNPEIIQPRIKKNKLIKKSNVFNDIVVNHQKRDGRFKNCLLPVPIWCLAERGMPNGLLRSALFGMVKRGTRARLNNVPLFTSRNTTLYFSGYELNQKDCDVFMTLLNLVQEQGTYRAECSLYGLRKMLFLDKGKKNTLALKMSIERLHDSSIKMKSPNAYYCGHLVDSFAFDERKGTYVLRINPDIANLFHDGFAKLKMETRLHLKGDLSKFLHGLVLTHRAAIDRPQLYKLETIHSLSRSKEKRRRMFKAKVASGMEQLKNLGVVLKWSISKEEVLSFTRPR